MNKTRTYLLLLLWLLLHTPNVRSQGFSAESFELSLSEGVSFFTAKSFQIGEPQSSRPLDHDLSFKNGNRHEARLNLFTTERFGLEASYGYQATDVVFDRITEPADQLTIPTQIHNFGVNLLYYPVGDSTSAWRPFATVGGGAMIFRPLGTGQEIAKNPIQGGLSDFIESSRGAFSAGAGVKRSLNRSFGLRVDLGVDFAAAPTFGLPAESDDPFQAVLPVTGRIANARASVGIILYLGR